jgi:hypothetical protein
VLQVRWRGRQWEQIHPNGGRKHSGQGAVCQVSINSVTLKSTFLSVCACFRCGNSFFIFYERVHNPIVKHTHNKENKTSRCSSCCFICVGSFSPASLFIHLRLCILSRGRSGSRRLKYMRWDEQKNYMFCLRVQYSAVSKVGRLDLHFEPVFCFGLVKKCTRSLILRQNANWNFN